MKHTKRNSGFTVIELICSLVVFVVFIGLVVCGILLACGVFTSDPPTVNDIKIRQLELKYEQEKLEIEKNRLETEMAE